MLGCGAYVRIIALPHVRCACGSACGKGFETVCAMCVHVALFGRVMCDRTFARFLEQNHHYFYTSYRLGDFKIFLLLKSSIIFFEKLGLEYSIKLYYTCTSAYLLHSITFNHHKSKT